MSRLDLGLTGVSLDLSDDGGHLQVARELEELGYVSVWVPGGQLDTLDRISELIEATSTVQVGSAIVSPDVHGPDDVLRLQARLSSAARDRFVLGLGGSQKPPTLPALHGYLDRLDDAPVPIPAERRVLAALGPRKLEIARQRCAGAITLLVTPDYTRRARAALGADSLLVVDQFVVLDEDPDRARHVARGHLQFLARVAGYRANFERMGFTEAEVSTLDDRLVDELVAWGDADAVVERVAAHRAAGADHVILAVLAEGDQPRTLTVAGLLADRLSRRRDDETT